MVEATTFREAEVILWFFARNKMHAWIFMFKTFW